MGKQKAAKVLCPECNKPFSGTGLRWHRILIHGINDKAQLAQPVKRTETGGADEQNKQPPEQGEPKPEVTILQPEQVAELAEQKETISRLQMIVDGHDTEAFSVLATQWGFDDMLKPVEVQLAEVATEENPAEGKPEGETTEQPASGAFLTASGVWSDSKPAVAQVLEKEGLLDRVAELGQKAELSPENKRNRDEAIRKTLSKTFESLLQQAGDTEDVRLLICNYTLGYMGASYGLHVGK